MVATNSEIIGNDQEDGNEILDKITAKYFHNGYGTKKEWNHHRCEISLARKLDLRQPLWQQILVAEMPARSAASKTKVDINAYNELRF